MSDSQEEMADRLKAARESAKYPTPTDAARAMGIEPPTYLGHENGSRGYRAAAPRYADFFKVNLEWLLTGRGTMKKVGSDNPAPAAQTEEVQPETIFTSTELNLLQLPQDLPILGGGACGEDGLFEMNGQVLGYTRRPPRLIGVKDAFAVYVYGESMVPWREPGSMAVVNPHQPPKIGDYVLVQLYPEDGTENKPAYIKKLVRRTAESLRLRQFNPPEEKNIAMRKVASIQRIVDWEEAMGG